MREQIVVSVICTCYNKQDWIRQALDSIVAQKADFPLEIIVVDDASTDGSLLEIEAFHDEHPDIVRVVTHAQNQGISRTWAEACSMAQGAYIARLDGDDVWTDETKLQAQVDALTNSTDSKWCSTDFDMMEQDGTIVVESALASGFVAMVDSYEQMLATKGLTNSSTWLVDTQLMNEVNNELDPDSADDTFTLQLEMFQRTKLTRVMKSMCAMRTVPGSDSRPKTDEMIRQRFEGLKKQQLVSLAKHPNVDYQKLSHMLIDACAEHEIKVEQLWQHAGRLEAKIAYLEERIAQLEENVHGYENSRNFIRPIQNAAKSILPHKR